MLIEIVFSATGSTQRIADNVCDEWGGEKRKVDLCIPIEQQKIQKIQLEDVCLVAVPVFEGRVPKPAVNRLKQLQGNGATAILVAVYGGRAVDDCLRELEDVLTAQGFVCRAAMEVVAQHSIMPQFCAGRPTAADEEEIRHFTRRIRESLEQGLLPQKVQVPGNSPYVEMGGVSLRPKGNGKCTHCGLCASKCPVGAIPVDRPNITDPQKCITCMRCVAVCPVHARNFPAIMVKVAGIAMKSKFSNNRENRLYIY